MGDAALFSALVVHIPCVLETLLHSFLNVHGPKLQTTVAFEAEIWQLGLRPGSFTTATCRLLAVAARTATTTALPGIERLWRGL